MGFSTPAAAPTAPKGKGKSTRTERDLVGLEKLASLGAVIQALQGRYDAIEAGLKEDVIDTLVDEAVENGGARPANSKMLEGIANAGFEIRSRSPRSVPSAEVITQLKAAQVPVKKVTVVPGYLAVNPKYAADKDMLAKADEFLAQAGLPDDFIVQTAAVENEVVGENAIEAVFASADAAEIHKLLPHVSTICFSKVTVSSFAAALEKIIPELTALGIAPEAANPVTVSSKNLNKAA